MQKTSLHHIFNKLLKIHKYLSDWLDNCSLCRLHISSRLCDGVYSMYLYVLFVQIWLMQSMHSYNWGLNPWTVDHEQNFNCSQYTIHWVTRILYYSRLTWLFYTFRKRTPALMPLYRATYWLSMLSRHNVTYQVGLRIYASHAKGRSTASGMTSQAYVVKVSQVTDVTGQVILQLRKKCINVSLYWHLNIWELHDMNFMFKIRKQLYRTLQPWVHYVVLRAGGLLYMWMNE